MLCSIVVAVSQQKTVLRRMRRDRELSIHELAKVTGINVSALSLGERGLQKFTPDQLDTLAKYFDTPADRLLAPVADEAVAS